MIFAITGNKGHGKDTFARAVQSADPEYNIVHFAGALKELAMQVFRLEWGQCHDPKRKEETLKRPIKLDDYVSPLRFYVGPLVCERGLIANTPRELLQYVGTEYVRSVYPSYWLDALSAQLRHVEKALVPDCRFLNEAERIRSLGGKVVRVERPELGENTDAHSSERELSMISVDHIVTNRTLSQLQRQAFLLVERYEGRLSA